MIVQNGEWQVTTNHYSFHRDDGEGWEGMDVMREDLIWRCGILCVVVDADVTVDVIMRVGAVLFLNALAVRII